VKPINDLKISVLLALSIIVSVLTIPVSPAIAQTASTEVVGMYIDAPFVQGSYASGDAVETEDFESYASSGSRTTIGIGNSMTGSYTMGDNNTYGGAARTDGTAGTGGTRSKFATAGSGGFTVRIDTSTALPLKYVGFYWTAGNAGNVVTFRSGGQEVARMTTESLTSTTFIGTYPGSGNGCPNSNYENSTASLNARNGSTSYYKKYYFGHPAERTGFTGTELARNGMTPTCPTSQGSFPEPFAYVHAFALNDQDFDEVTFGGTGFEIDNITFSTEEVSIDDRLVAIQNVSTSLTVGSSSWSIKGVSSSDPSAESTGWRSESLTATSGNSVVIKQTLEISSGSAITPGRTSLIRAPLNDTSTVSCGSYSVVDSFTITTSTSYETITVSSSGSVSRTNLIRGFCYVWTKNPSYTVGSANLNTTYAVRPTAGNGTIFRSNLSSPVLYLPKLPDVKIPSVIPVVPSNQRVSFPATKITQGSGQVQACFFENDGSSINGTWGTLAANQNLGFNSNSTRSNPFIGTSSTNALSLFNNLKISRINGSKFSGDRYLLIRIAPYLGTDFTTNCTGTGSGNNVTFASNLWPNSSNVYLVRLKGVSLKRTHAFVISPRNGRDN
jgi:hypothetical protein